MSRYPRAPKRHRVVECFPDCQALDTGDPHDCRCGERDEELYDLECERRLDAWKNGDYEDRS